ncbi:hypothetical protein CHI06_18825 [Bacillus sp. 7884-1]|nr:hypothetical protein CHI06_18825 [Bacillus sp. 7884-1]
MADGENHRRNFMLSFCNIPIFQGVPMTYLLVMIEETQLKLQELVDQYGMTSEKTIECSKQLDTLLYLLEQAIQNKKTTEENKPSLG